MCQIIRVVWNAWRSFVPQAQVKRHAKGRAAAHWHRRALILSFAWWHSYTAVMKTRRQQLADALLRWDTRRMWLVLEGWRAVTHYKQHKQQQLAQVQDRQSLVHQLSRPGTVMMVWPHADRKGIFPVDTCGDVATTCSHYDA